MSCIIKLQRIENSDHISDIADGNFTEDGGEIVRLRFCPKSKPLLLYLVVNLNHKASYVESYYLLFTKSQVS